MTPEQALQRLDAAASQASLNRIQHVQVQEAVQVLSALIKEVEGAKKKE